MSLQPRTKNTRDLFTLNPRCHMTASFHHPLSTVKTLVAASMMALTLLGAGSAAAQVTDAEANLPASSRADYRGVESAVADAEANLPASSRADYQGVESAVADAEANLPASSRADYRGVESAVADAEANLPASSRADYQGVESAVADAEANLPASSRADYRGTQSAVADAIQGYVSAGDQTSVGITCEQDPVVRAYDHQAATSCKSEWEGPPMPDGPGHHPY